GCLITAVEYLHEQKIRHKDLKPSNILLGPNDVWLTDFGSATDFSMLSQSATDGVERGTPKYFAPEVASFEPHGRAADMFSLGCVLLEI
ncbi:kinase-like protein, partial [Corynespora cassiicola Philippines]